MARLPWRKIGLTAAAAALFVFFWINGPLQARPPVFEFEPHMVGFDEPGRVGENYIPPTFGVVGPEERHPFWHIMAAKEAVRPLHAVIGDPAANPALKEDVAKLIFTHARKFAANPDGVKMKAALELFYAEERDRDGKLTQLYLENTGLNKDVKGYAGPIDIGVTIGMDGKIRNVRHLRSRETTSYLNNIEKKGFYDRFQGIRLDDKTYEIDLVTGASLTTEGVARSVSQLISLARESPLEIYLDTRATGFDVRAVVPKTWIIDAAVIVALFLIAWSGIARKSPVLSLAYAAFTVGYLGFFLNDSFTYVTYTQPFLGTTWSWLLGIYAALVLLSSIWDGNTYCRYVCPYGNVQRLLLRVIPFRGKLPVSNRVINWLRLALLVALAVGIAAGLRDWGSYELFPDLFGLEFMSSPWFWLAVATVLVSTYYPMLWCRLLCPTGAFLDGIADLARERRRDQKTTALAGIPVKVEPAGAVR